MKAVVQKTESMRRTRLELFINGNNNKKIAQRVITTLTPSYLL